MKNIYIEKVYTTISSGYFYCLLSTLCCINIIMLSSILLPKCICLNIYEIKLYKFYLTYWEFGHSKQIILFYPKG